MSEWSLPDPSMKTGDLLAELKRARRRCPVCEQVIDPDREPVKLYAVPVGPVPDRLAVMPFHARCWPEARERLERAKAAIRARATGAEAN